MIEVLKKFKSVLAFTHYNDWRNNLLFKKSWSNLDDWKRLRATYVYRWEQHAMNSTWLDYYPGVTMPIDFLEEAERQNAKVLQAKNGNEKWGLEIGIRYFPTKEYFPPVFVHEIFIFPKEFVQVNEVKYGSEWFRLHHFYECILAEKLTNLDKRFLLNYKYDLLLDLNDENRNIQFGLTQKYPDLYFASDAEVKAHKEKVPNFSDEKLEMFNKALIHGVQTELKLLKHSTENKTVCSLAIF